MNQYDLKIRIERYVGEAHATYQADMVGEVPKCLASAMAKLRDDALAVAREKGKAITLDVKVQSEL